MNYVKKSTGLTLIMLMVFMSIGVGVGFAGYPADTNPLTLVSDPTVPMPAYKESIIDPTFGTTITRITDQQAFNAVLYPSPSPTPDPNEKDYRHGYAKVEPWNADGSLMFFPYPTSSAANKVLADGRTYDIIKTLQLPSDPRWSHTDPNKIYGIDTTTKYNFVSIDTNSTITTIHSFTAYDQISIGNSEGNLSNDDRFVVFDARKGTGSLAHWYAVVYDILNDAIISTLDEGVATTDPIDAAMISQSGKYVVINWNASGTSRNQGVEVFLNDTVNKALTYQRQLVNKGEHGDVGYDAAGNEVWVQLISNPTPGSIMSYRLSDGVATENMPDSSGTCLCKDIMGGHVSMRSDLRPGWAYFSPYDPTNPSDWAYDEVLAIKLDGSGTVERFGHEHHSVPSSSYQAQPQAVPSRDGTKIVFASDWGAYNATTNPNPLIYDYVAENKGTNQNIHFVSTNTTDLHGTRQSITYNRTVGTLVVSGSSKALNVSGSQNSDYSIYVDVHYTDGTSLSGQTAQFATGTHDWATASVTITPTKSVANINVYVMFRYKTGSAWFDNVSVSENGGANQLLNPGFETGITVPLSSWTVPSPYIAYSLDRSSQIVKATSTTTTDLYGAEQDLTLNRVVGPLTISGKSKALNISGSNTNDYGLWVTIIYTDSTNEAAHVIFNTGTHDWEVQSATFTPNPAKTVATIKFYTMFRYKTGTASFEDVRLTESQKEGNMLLNPGFDTGSSVPIANWTQYFSGYTLGWN